MSQFMGEEHAARQPVGLETGHPPNYDERRSILEFLRPLAEWLGRFLLFVVLVTVFALLIPQVATPAIIVGIVVGLYCAWRIKAAHWVWVHRRIVVDGATGVLTIKQGGPIWWGLKESSDDKVKLAGSSFRTIDRRLWQREFLFNCDTIVVRMPDSKQVITNVLHAKRIEEIHAYVNGMDRQNLVQQVRQTQLLEQIAASMQRPVAPSSEASAPDALIDDTELLTPYEDDLDELLARHKED